MIEYYINHLKFIAPIESKKFLEALTYVFLSPTPTDVLIRTNDLVQKCISDDDDKLFESLVSFLMADSAWINEHTGYSSSVYVATKTLPGSLVWVELFDQWRQFHPEVGTLLDRRIFFAAFYFSQIAYTTLSVLKTVHKQEISFDLVYSEGIKMVVREQLVTPEYSSNLEFLNEELEVFDPRLQLELRNEVNLDPTGFEYRFFLESLHSFWILLGEPNRRLETDYDFRQRVTNVHSEYESFIQQLLIPWDNGISDEETSEFDYLLESDFDWSDEEDSEDNYLSESDFDLPNQNGVLNNEPPKLSSGGAVVPSNENNYQSKVDANYSLDDSILHGTENSASVGFLHEETILDHFLSTYIDKFDLLSQITWNGVWGFFVTIVKFIYGLHKLHFFFLFQKVKIKKLMKWWGKKFK